MTFANIARSVLAIALTGLAAPSPLAAATLTAPHVVQLAEDGTAPPSETDTPALRQDEGTGDAESPGGQLPRLDEDSGDDDGDAPWQGCPVRGNGHFEMLT